SQSQDRSGSPVAGSRLDRGGPAPEAPQGRRTGGGGRFHQSSGNTPKGRLGLSSSYPRRVLAGVAGGGGNGRSISSRGLGVMAGSMRARTGLPSFGGPQEHREQLWVPLGIEAGVSALKGVERGLD